jgi:hypothetical protein
MHTQTYEKFALFLSKRISSGQHLTEDSVRYAFFAALLESTDLEQHEIVLELPHPQFRGKEIDTYVSRGPDRPETFLEFKFHRASNSTSPKPQKAGSLFKDFARLASVTAPDSQCLVIYLTCPEMATYFTANAPAYSGFWSTRAGERFHFDQAFTAKTTPTFRKVSGDSVAATISVEYDSRIGGGYELRVFRVYPLLSSAIAGEA